jgi:hypothetical protein
MLARNSKPSFLVDWYPKAYRSALHGESAKIKRLLEFAVASGEAKAGQSDTLLFPAAFGR